MLLGNQQAGRHPQSIKPAKKESKTTTKANTEAHSALKNIANTSTKAADSTKTAEKAQTKSPQGEKAASGKKPESNAEPKSKKDGDSGSTQNKGKGK